MKTRETIRHASALQRCEVPIGDARDGVIRHCTRSVSVLVGRRWYCRQHARSRVADSLALGRCQESNAQGVICRSNAHIEVNGVWLCGAHVCARLEEIGASRGQLRRGMRVGCLSLFPLLWALNAVLPRSGGFFRVAFLCERLDREEDIFAQVDAEASGTLRARETLEVFRALPETVRVAVVRRALEWKAAGSLIQVGDERYRGPYFLVVDVVTGRITYPLPPKGITPVGDEVAILPCRDFLEPSARAS
jgi:hypothetical protein